MIGSAIFQGYKKRSIVPGTSCARAGRHLNAFRAFQKGIKVFILIGINKKKERMD
jgi:hypothetical protein